MRTFSRTLARTGVLQVDSVNVLQRAHYMPLFSRMGPYDTDMLKRASERKPRRMVEYWAHVQAFMPVDLWPVMQHRMDRRSARARAGAPGCRPTASVVDRVHDQVRDARRLDRPRARRPALRARRSTGAGTGRRPARRLDYLFVVGDLAIAGRNGQFEPVYDLAERVLPPAVLAAPVPTAFEVDQGAGPSRRPQPRGGHGALPDRLLPPPAPDGGRAPRPPSWRSTSSSRRASCCRSRSRAGSGRRGCTATPSCPARSMPARC